MKNFKEEFMAYFRSYWPIITPWYNATQENFVLWILLLCVYTVDSRNWCWHQYLLVFIFTDAIKCCKCSICCWRDFTYLFLPLFASVNLLQLMCPLCLSLQFKLCSYCSYLVTLHAYNFVLQIVMPLQISCRILLNWLRFLLR